MSPKCWNRLYTCFDLPRCHSLSWFTNGSLKLHDFSTPQSQLSHWAWHMWGHQGKGCLWQIRGLSSCQMCQDQIIDWGLAAELPNWPNCQKAPKLNQESLTGICKTNVMCICSFILFGITPSDQSPLFFPLSCQGLWPHSMLIFPPWTVSTTSSLCMLRKESGKTIVRSGLPARTLHHNW